MYQLPVSPKSPSIPPTSPNGRPVHLQPIEANGRISHMPTTPSKSNLGPVGKATGNVSMHKSNSDISLASLQQQQPQQQQQSDADNIKVVVRIRPLFSHEASKGATQIAEVSEDCSSLKVVVPGPNGATMQREFSFHACLGPDTSQADITALCGINQLLDAALAGYHVTIFAYGQTGSGKTHTMSGKEDIISDDAYFGNDQDGIISRAVQYLFHQVHTRKDAKYSLKASYLEVYNEGVYDLVHFSPKARSLPVKWDASYGFFVQGLNVVPCGQQRTMMEVVRTGMKHRKVGSHRLNTESSRSHSIMTIYCDATPTDPTSYDYGTMRYGKLSFVDLAGSERVKDSMSEGTMMKETININKSLSVLGKVISTLAERDAAGTTAHVPYRDSKLTKLLMDSLGGSALTLMIACCSPSSLQVDETLSTLSYATRAKNIHNRPTVQYDPREAQIALLRREIELLRQENTLFRQQLRGGALPEGALHVSLPTTPDAAQLLATKRQFVSAIGGLGYPMLPQGGSILGGNRPFGPLSPGALGNDSPTAAATAAAATMGQPGSPTGQHAADAIPAVRANSSPDSLHTRGPAPVQSGTGVTGAEQQLKLSLNELDLRANAARQLVSGINNGNELVRRLHETQQLLINFSEENSRLARENEKLQAGRNVLSAEHATVLDEIDLLKGKLTQLERSVLTAATGSSEGSAGVPPDIPATAVPASAVGQASNSRALAAAGVGSAGPGIDIKALLASLGLGEEAVASLSAVGVGPRLMPEGEGHEQEAGPSGSPDPLGSGRNSLQSSSSTHSDHNFSSNASFAPWPESPNLGRPFLELPTGTKPLSGNRSTLGSANSSSSSLAPTAKSLPNRTPLTHRGLADAGLDDSIIVSNTAGLAVLLSSPKGASTGHRIPSATVAGAAGPAGAWQSSQQQPYLGSSSSMPPGSQQRLAGAAGGILPAAASLSQVPKTVGFSGAPGEAFQPAVDVYQELPSSATATSASINRILPYKLGERGVPHVA